MKGSVRQRFNFQASAIGRDQPSLTLHKRQLITTPTPTATGLAQDRPTLQTCLVAGPGLKEAFGVTREQLTAMADQLASGRRDALERGIGLQPNRRYGCTLISLRGARGAPPPTSSGSKCWAWWSRCCDPSLRPEGPRPLAFRRQRLLSLLTLSIRPVPSSPQHPPSASFWGPSNSLTRGLARAKPLPSSGGHDRDRPPAAVSAEPQGGGQACPADA